jgi:hypothetical protein
MNLQNYELQNSTIFRFSLESFKKNDHFEIILGEELENISLKKNVDSSHVWAMVNLMSQLYICAPISF